MGRASGVHGPRTGGAGARCPSASACHGPWDGRWRRVVCLASGPSLTADDVERVRRWRFEEEEEGRAVVVVNTTFRSALWADALYAMDEDWWKFHHAEVMRTFTGKLYAPITRRGISRVSMPYSVSRAANSGAGAISVAALNGAREIILLGYDCKFINGKRHHHGDHPIGAGCGNAGTIDKWPGHFRHIADVHRDVRIINCSRDTALDAFPRAELESALCG